MPTCTCILVLAVANGADTSLRFGILILVSRQSEALVREYAQPTASGSTTPSGTPPPSRTSCGKCFWRSTCSPATVCTCTRQGEIRKNSKLAINFLHNIIISKFSQVVPNLAQHFKTFPKLQKLISNYWFSMLSSEKTDVWVRVGATQSRLEAFFGCVSN